MNEDEMTREWRRRRRKCLETEKKSEKKIVVSVWPSSLILTGTTFKRTVII